MEDGIGHAARMYYSDGFIFFGLFQKYFQDLKSLEKIDLYLKTIRKGPANDEYFGEVVRALGFTK